MEVTAPAQPSRRLGGHRTAQPAGEFGRVVGQFHQRRHGDRSRELDVADPAGAGGPLRQQSGHVRRPAERILGLRPVRTRPDRFRVHRVARAGRFDPGRPGAARSASAPSTRSAPATTAGRRPPSGSTGHGALRGAMTAASCGSGGGAHASGSRERLGQGGALEEELAGPGRFGGGRTPVVTGEQQGAFGPGQRDVEQPPLLGQPELGEVGGVRRPGHRRDPSGCRRRAASAAAGRPGRPGSAEAAGPDPPARCCPG